MRAPTILLCTAVAALKPQPSPTHTTRRAAVGSFFAAAFGGSALPAYADDEPRATGFGVRDTSLNGMPAEQAPPGSLPYSEFLKAVTDKKVEGVVFEPPSGDVAFALIDGKSVRIGEGWPKEMGNSWSSPTWVMRILEDEGVPYKFNIKLNTKPKARTSGAGYAANPYVPDSSKKVSALDTTGADGKGFKAQPKMYGGAAMGLDESTPDYAGNFGGL